MKKVLHLTTHLNSGGITVYILRLVDFLRSAEFETLIFSCGGEYASLFQEKNVKLLMCDIRTKSEIHPKLIPALGRLIRAIREEKIDILHAHTRITQVLAYWAGKYTGVPVVTTCHGFYKVRLGRRLLPAWGQRAIAISEPVGKHLADDFHVPAKSIRVVSNAVDIKLLDEQYQKHSSETVRKDFGFAKEDRVIGIVARLVNDKGHEYLLRAAAELYRDFPDIRILIVGDGRERPILEDLAKALGIEARVVFTGNITDVSRALAAMDIFAFPATWREGFGLSIVEAMTCGKPVIVTNIWALNSLIQNEDTGFLVEPKSVPALAEAIRKLLEDAALRRRIGESARKAVERLFTIERMAAEISDVYKETLTPALKSL